MIKIISKMKIFFYNVFSFIIGFIVGRSKRNVIVGAWGGRKYADNSRYLFEYLSSHKKDLGFKHVIWATRDTEIYKFLVEQGFEVCLIGSKKSSYYHLKSGVHIICNMSFSFGKFEPDIDTRFSCGAKKIQLWHGVGIKRVGLTSNFAAMQYESFFSKIMHSAILKSVFSQGCWMNQYTLGTSSLNADWLRQSLDCNGNRMFISSYPRFCSIQIKTKEEVSVLDFIKQFETSILHCPTFRTDYSHYCHPLENQVFLDYITENNILFIEKPHPASSYFAKQVNKNVLILGSEFDTTVLIKHCSCIISDYSSAVFDGIHCNVPVIQYVPDLAYFSSSDVGLYMDIESSFSSIISKTVEDVIPMLEKIRTHLYFDEKTVELFEKTDLLFFNGEQKTMQEIWDDISIACKL